MSELAAVLSQLQAAKNTQDVFGSLVGDDTDRATLNRTYHRLAKVCHPDKHQNGGREAAQEAFVLLQRWYDLAQSQLDSGIYGQTPTVTLRSKHGTYTVSPDFAFSGDFCSIYRGTESDGTQVAVKVAKHPRDNDLVTNERTALKQLTAKVEKYHPYFPVLYDGFTYQDTSGKRAANVLDWLSGCYTLEEITKEGVDPKDVAWMFRRLLIALGAAHSAGVLHGAVLPSHVLIHPEQHGLVLVDWTCAVKQGEVIPALSPAYESLYPPEVLTKKAAGTATDLYMAAKTMLSLGTFPKPFAAFFRGCALPTAQQRPQHAWTLLAEFDNLLIQMWGRRTFHPFVVDAPCPR